MRVHMRTQTAELFRGRGEKVFKEKEINQAMDKSKTLEISLLYPAIPNEGGGEKRKKPTPNSKLSILEHM